MWEVKKKKIDKAFKKLPLSIKNSFDILVEELKEFGPFRKSWPNYSKLRGRKDEFHCHLNKGKPRYVAYWIIIDKKIEITEVTYVGTHEKAPY